MNAWVLLAIAIGFEVTGTLLLKMSNGFENWKIGTVAILCYWVSFWFFAPVLKLIPTGIAYAIWAGVAIGLVTLAGLVLFGQKLSFSQFGFLAMIFVGAIGLSLTTDVFLKT